MSISRDELGLVLLLLDPAARAEIQPLPPHDQQEILEAMINEGSLILPACLRHRRRVRKPEPVLFPSFLFSPASLAFCAAAVALFFYAATPPAIGWEAVVTGPLYQSGSLMFESLQRGERIAAETLGWRADQPFTAHKLGDGASSVITNMHRVSQAAIGFWGADTTNSTVRAHRNNMYVAIKQVREAQEVLFAFDRNLSRVLWASSDKANLTLQQMDHIKELPVGSVHPNAAMFKIWWRSLRATLDGSVTPLPSNVQIQQRCLWSEACSCLGRLTELSERVLVDLGVARTAIRQPAITFDPIQDFLRTELRRRQDDVDRQRTILLSQVDRDTKAWTALIWNRWRNSSSVALNVCGFLLGGLTPPNEHEQLLNLIQKTNADLDEAESHVYLTIAHLEAIKRELSSIQAEMAGVTDPAEERPLHANIPCYNGTFIYSSAAPLMTPHEYVLFLDSLWANFRFKMTHWDRAAFIRQLAKAAVDNPQGWAAKVLALEEVLPYSS